MAKFKVYNASAGAGKTYTLVREFLKICLRGENSTQYRHILAITFTNKAANEMKQRIVQKLEVFADEKLAKHDPMFLELVEDLNVSEVRLSYISQAALKSILHNYSAFSVSTIDKFTNRLIRSFAQDLRLSSNYEVELDADDLLQSAVDRMLADLQEGSDTSEILLEFIKTKLDDGKSPRPEQSLHAMGKNLFDEGAYPYLKLLRGVGKGEILTSAKSLAKEKKGLEEKWSAQAKDIFSLLDKHGIEKGDFSGGYLYNFLGYVRDTATANWPVNKTVEKVVFNGDPFYAKTKAKTLAAKFDPIEDELRIKLNDLFGEMVEVYPRYHLIGLILRDVYSLAVLAEIENNLQEVKDEENKLPIGEFNKLISEKLENEPTAYLFEKLGDRYQYFFIDEFQDTSVLQWRNLLPLINNALASSGEAMIVGDAKQSIYRWRGGEVGQFIDLSNDVGPENKVLVNDVEVELYTRETINLEYNFRSKRNVVAFNNEFFTNCVPLLEGKMYQDIYHQSGQKIRHDEGGFVRVKQIDFNKDLYEDDHCRETFETISDCLERGYSLKDITIITRKKDFLAVIAEYLLAKGIKVISPDSLLLGQSPEVRAVVSYLKYLCRPDDYAARWDFLNMIWRQGYGESYSDSHLFMADLIKRPPAKFNEKLSELLDGYDYDYLMQQGLLDKVYMLVNWLGIDAQTNPFMHAFLDYVSDFQNKKHGGEAEFCRHWDEKGALKSITLPEGVDAVSLMTVHKSKGLEFPITIVPFADWLSTSEPRGSQSWIDLRVFDMEGLPVARVGLSKNPNAMEEYTMLYEQNKGLVYLDNLNLAYVAFTRAVDELYVFGSKGKRHDTSNLTIYLNRFFENKEVEGSEWEVGERIVKGASDALDAGSRWVSYQNVPWQDRLRITIDAPMDWQKGESEGTSYGKKVHGLFSMLGGSEDLEDVLAVEVSRGRLREDEVDDLRVLVDAVLTHKDLQGYFQKPVRVLNEQELILPKGKSLRPDRLVVDGNKVHIIDYKTGVALPKHKEQLDEYANVLQEMGFEKGDRVLIYMNESVEVEKW